MTFISKLAVEEFDFTGDLHVTAASQFGPDVHVLAAGTAIAAVSKLNVVKKVLFAQSDVHAGR
ncbi:hypothetical protein [Bradyrhizobium sp. 76]|uniref:hypothetical protein n=1 Tax=Bradyrhizobium sp. 76 TaxID=2782680 RepID=UPI001FF7D9FC|nr:hypothetical protein [Bradyrhizobium sp. 76]MCK1410390.1 hypothetical protein [Bradyrhizobium sp. 76]